MIYPSIYDILYIIILVVKLNQIKEIMIKDQFYSSLNSEATSRFQQSLCLSTLPTSVYLLFAVCFYTL